MGLFRGLDFRGDYTSQIKELFVTPVLLEISQMSQRGGEFAWDTVRPVSRPGPPCQKFGPLCQI